MDVCKAKNICKSSVKHENKYKHRLQFESDKARK